jgi:hypothetical protein
MLPEVPASPFAGTTAAFRLRGNDGCLFFEIGFMQSPCVIG